MSPALSGTVPYSDCQAVAPAQGSVEASSKLRWFGNSVIACGSYVSREKQRNLNHLTSSGNTRYWVSTPSTFPPPRTELSISRVGFPEMCFSTMFTETRCPTLNFVADDPTATTIPAASESGMKSSFRLNNDKVSFSEVTRKGSLTLDLLRSAQL